MTDTMQMAQATQARTSLGWSYLLWHRHEPQRKCRPQTTSSATCRSSTPDEFLFKQWPYQWTGDPNGASTDPCAQTYKGQAQGDTPEIKALVSHMQNVSRSQNLTQYIDFHSYGNYILSPYGYTSAVPANSNAQVGLGQKAAAAIRGECQIRTLGLTSADSDAFSCIWNAIHRRSIRCNTLPHDWKQWRLRSRYCRC